MADIRLKSVENKKMGAISYVSWFMVLACCELFRIRFHFGSSNLVFARVRVVRNYIHAKAEEDRRRAAKDTGGNPRVDMR